MTHMAPVIVRLVPRVNLDKVNHARLLHQRIGMCHADALLVYGIGVDASVPSAAGTIDANACER